MWLVYPVTNLAAVSVHAGPDGGDHEGGRDDEQGQRRRGHRHQRVEEVRPEVVSVVTTLHPPRHHPEHHQYNVNYI